MSKAETLWNNHISYAYACLYHPWVVGIATGQLPESAWIDYVKQDIHYLRIYESAYAKAINLCEINNDMEHKEILEEICIGLRKELESHIQTASQCEESMPKKATRDYMELVRNAYEYGSLSEIASAICPCNKLYEFLGTEISSAFPDHHHAYSEWIRAYSGDQIVFDTNQIESMVNVFPAPLDPTSLTWYYGEAMRLEYAFFDQLDFVPPLFTTQQIQCVGVGNMCRTAFESSDAYNRLLNANALPTFPSLPFSEQEGVTSFQEKCTQACIPVQSVEEKPINKHISLGFGTFSQIHALLQYDIPVLIQPSEAERQLLVRCGYSINRLITLFQYTPNKLPSQQVYTVEHFTEIGMTVLGSAYLQAQPLPVVPTLLSIAGSDSCGGAGIQADIKTATSLGVVASSCITAITSQNTQGVKLVELVSETSLKTQLQCVCEDIQFFAVKIGMTGSRENVSLIAQAIEQYGLRNVVFDPVMAASSGQKLSKGDLCQCFKERLIPLCDLVTPNLPETQLLLGYPVEGTVEAMTQAAKELIKLGCKNVLVKGGHMEGKEAVDVLYEGETKQITYFRHPFVFTTNSHGTGCTLSSAIASYLAKGFSMKLAVQKGGEYIENILKQSRFLHIGKGKQGIMNHMWMNYTFE